MRKKSRPVGGLVMTALGVVTLVTAGTAVAVAPAQAQPSPFVVTSAGEGAVSVTLVTGDRVDIRDGVVTDVVLGSGREEVGYRQYVEHGAVYVVPNDAAPWIANGTLDKRLFDVTALVKADYHDGARDDVPVMVSYREGTVSAAGVSARITADGAAEQVRSLAAIDGAAVEAEKAEAETFWENVRPMLKPGAEIEHLWLDAPVQATLAESVPQIGAPEAWDSGLTGEGVRVAVLDTGIDADHPDLADAVVEAKDFTGSGNTDDGQGHGTHVAATILGDGSASDGRYRGVAPDAELVVGKVLSDNGSGQESWILAGMEWAAENASVVNMSLGANATDGTDPMSEAVNRLTEETGTLFVVSAGNNGSSEESVGSPGAADAALTVGAVTKDDELAYFSSRGPRLGDGAVKPDVTAPGVDIVSAKAAGTEMGAPVGDHYVTASGTSMSAPHVAGAAALLAQQHEDWDADELKAALMASARPHDALSVYEQGAGRIDVPGALEQSVLASPASVSLGMVGWPYSDEPVREKVTYTNTSDEPVTLELSGELSGPNGAAPEGMITVEPSQLTVPAGGTAEATVSVDVTIAGSHGAYGGLVLASAGDTTVRTPVGIELEEESYTFQVEALDFDGKAAQEAYVHMARLDGEVSLAEIFTDGTLSLRAPKGEYFMQVVVYEDMTAFGRTADFYEPRVVVDGDSSVTLDARKAQPVSVSLDDLPDAEMGELEVSAIVGTVGGPGVVTGSVDPETMLIAPSQTSHEDFDFTVRTRHARPDGNGGYVGSPYTVHVSNTTEGAVPEDLTYEVSVAELAKVTSVHSDAGAGDVGRRELVTAELPFTLTEYYTPGVEWDTRLELGKTEDFDYVGGLYHSEVFERAGDNGVRTWNTPVFGPAFSPNSVARSENYLWFHPSLHSDPGRGSTGDVWVTGYTELYRDGELLEKFDVAGGGKFNLPSESSEYRLVTEADASELMSVSRLVKAEWTFRSEYADGTVDVPLLAVRFEPDLGEDSVVKAGEKLRIPVRVQRNGDAKEPTLAALQVEASFDGGESWKVVKHKTSRGDRYVTVTAPKGAKDVSLRAVAKDTEGNEVKQTIIGAYLVK